jgi:5-methylcytosine-specific restriction endonuclease McrA
VFVAVRKRAEREEARRLRELGWSLRRIARALGVSVSSASVWTRGVLPPEEPVGEVAAVEAGEFRCASCGQTLPRSDMCAPSSRHSWCRECLRSYFRSRGELHRRQTYAAKAVRRENAREHVVALLANGSCVDCGLADPMVLEFDHLGPKADNISDLVKQGCSLKRLTSELENCELVCANCHRLRTIERDRPDRLPSQAARPRVERNLRYVASVLDVSSCTDCGETQASLLEFDHVGPKRDSVVQLAFTEYSIRAIEEEIARCEVRCANCHRRRTHGVTGTFRHHVLGPL